MMALFRDLTVTEREVLLEVEREVMLHVQTDKPMPSYHSALGLPKLFLL